MKLALREGRKGLGRTSPNPAVGAVIVSKNGKEILGRGWHHKAGHPHAEVEAIADATAKFPRRSLAGTTIYVTLEPCSTTGKTGACTDAILKVGFGRVVIGTLDPNPAHAGAAVRILAKAGIDVSVGVCEDECRELIRFFAKHISTGKPYVIAKSAITLDGRTTLTKSRGQWISGPESREDVQRLRTQCDAVLIGGETARADNPLLTLRGKHAVGRDQPWRVVLTAIRELPEDLNLFTDDFADRTEVFHGESLARVLTTLGKRGITSVLLESGGRLFAHGIAKKLIDEVVIYQAPIIGGGGKRLMPVDNIIADLDNVSVKRIGNDTRIRGIVRK